MSHTTLPCSKETLAKIRSLKRGGITYDELLSEMAEQYEPDEPEVNLP
jgi:hypothetical protein